MSGPSATIAPSFGGPTVDPQHLTLIAAACRDFECVRFAYRRGVYALNRVDLAFQPGELTAIIDLPDEPAFNRH